MRQILSLSLPQQVVKDIKKNTKKKGFPSVSSYIKYLFESDNDTISTDELLEDVKFSEKEYQKGKSIKASSLADLL